MEKFQVLRGNHVDPRTGSIHRAGSIVDSNRNLDKMDPSKYKKVTAAQAQRIIEGKEDEPDETENPARSKAKRK